MSVCTISSDVAFPYDILIFRHIVPSIDKHKTFTKRFKGLKTWVRKMQTEKGRHSNKILRGAPTYCSDKLQIKGKKHLSSPLIISEGNQRALVDVVQKNFRQSMWRNGRTVTLLPCVKCWIREGSPMSGTIR